MSASFMPGVFNGLKKAGDAIFKMRSADAIPKAMNQIIPHANSALMGWDGEGNPANWTIAELFQTYATTNYVDGKVSQLLGGAPPAALDTLTELATQLQNDESAVVALTTQVASKLPSSSFTWDNLPGKPAGFSGSYNDLTNKPTLGTAAYQASTAFATAAQGAKADTALQSVPAQTWASITGKPTIVTYSAATTTVAGIVLEAQALTAAASVALTNNTGGTTATVLTALPAIVAPALLTVAASQASVTAAVGVLNNNQSNAAMQYNLLLARFEQLVAKLQGAGLLAT